MDCPPFLQDEPFILTVAGVKENIGKSLIAVNMAVQYAKTGLRVILVDHDLAAANMQTLHSIQEDKFPGSASNRHTNLQHFLLEEGVPNLLMIPGNNFGLDFTSMNPSHKTKFFNKVKEISTADVVIIDLGGGASEQSLDILLMAHAGIIVTNTEPESIIHTYEFLKNAVYRTVYRMFRGQGELQAIIHSYLTRTDRQQPPTVEGLAAAIAVKNPWAAQNLLEVCKDLDFYVIINQAHTPTDTQLAAKLHSICHKYLGIDPRFPGILYNDHEIPARANIMAPQSITHPDSATCQAISRIGAFILDNMIHQRLTDSPKLKSSALCSPAG